MTKQEYMNNPCGTSALPYYKKDLKVDATVLHMNDLSDEYKSKEPQRFFKIIHDLKNIPTPTLKSRVVEESDLDEVVKIIKSCYPNTNVGYNYFLDKMKSRVYDKNLWRFIYKNDSLVALGVCDYDDEVKEVVLDWIQVLPEYQKQGIGKELVYIMLNKAPKSALYATVSGDVDNPHSPEQLYRSCGFTGKDVWYIFS